MILMKKYISFLFLVGFLISSCEKKVTIDIPEKPPRLVLNSILEKGDSVRVVLGKTRHILSPHPLGNTIYSYLVKDAEVVLYENNLPVDTLVYSTTTFHY